MKHTIPITILLLSMFLVTQVVGLAVIYLYKSAPLPYGMQPPQLKPEISIISIVISIFVAVSLIFLLMKIRAVLIMRVWFFSVVSVALAISINAFLKGLVPYSKEISLAIALALSFVKIFKRDMIVHNLTEILIYPGIAAIFAPLFGISSVFILLVIISAYDIYAVWYAKFMQEMAKFQIKELRFFAGFFVPYVKGASMKTLSAKKGRKIKVSLAILGGGDVAFPLLAAGVVLRAWGFIPAAVVSLFSAIGLLFIFWNARKGRFYPAMPFISAGSFLGLLTAFLLRIL